jgi:hypothetical protein
MDDAYSNPKVGNIYKVKDPSKMVDIEYWIVYQILDENTILLNSYDTKNETAGRNIVAKDKVWFNADNVEFVGKQGGKRSKKQKNKTKKRNKSRRIKRRRSRRY